MTSLSACVKVASQTNPARVFTALSAGYFLVITVTLLRHSDVITRPHALRQTSSLSHSSTESATVDDSHQLLCLFTTFKFDPRKFTVINNTLHNWASLDDRREAGLRRIRPIMFVVNKTMPSPLDVDDVLVTSARQLGWTVLPVSRVSSSGLPFVKDMYFDAASRFPNCTFYALSNGDILFTQSLLHSLQAVAQRLSVLNDTLVIGRRWNVHIAENETLYSPQDIEQIISKKRGRMHKTFAVDYFIIARNKFPWQRMPNVVIARRGYDNFLVMLAVRHNVSVVDATQTLLAVHQTDTEARDARRHRVADTYNLHRLPGFNYAKGYTSSAQYVTKFGGDIKSNVSRTIVLRSRVSGETF